MQALPCNHKPVRPHACMRLPLQMHKENTAEYNGSVSHPVRIQELPAVFLARRLSQLVFYDGASPWTGGAVRVWCAAFWGPPLLRAGSSVLFDFSRGLKA